MNSDSTPPRNAPAVSSFGLTGIALFVLGGMLLINLNEDETFFGLTGFAALSLGIHNLIVAAVARGIDVAR